MIKPIMGSILFLGVCLVIFSGISWLGSAFLSWFNSLPLVKQIAIFTMLSSFLWLMFRGLKEMLINLSSKLSIGLVFSVLTIAAFSVVNGGRLIYNALTTCSNNTGRQIIPSIFLLILILEIMIAPILDLPKILRKDLSSNSRMH